MAQLNCLQYVSCSWDKTIRVWNAWKKQTKKKEIVEENSEGKTDKMKKVEIMMEGEEWEEEGEGPGEGAENETEGGEAQNGVISEEGEQDG